MLDCSLISRVVLEKSVGNKLCTPLAWPLYRVKWFLEFLQVIDNYNFFM